MRSLFGNIPSEMRTLLLGGSMLCSGVALAEEPIAAGDSNSPSVVTQSTTTTVTTSSPTAPALPPPPMVSAPIPAPAPAVGPIYAPPAVPGPIYAPPAYPPQTMGSFQGPVYYNGPVWIVPAPNGGPPPQMMAPAPPVYTAPPAPLYAPPPPARYYVPPRPAVPYYAKRYVPPSSAYRAAPRGPVVGLGVRFSAMGISSQQVFGQNVNLLGGGLFMRFRSQGRFGFELGIDALRTDINDGAFVRTSYPFTVAPMFYIFQNRPDQHFNMYAVAGFGLVADDIALYKGSSQERNQQFWEVMGQAGGGIELRFHRIGLFADVRAIGMLLDDSTPAGIYYQNVEGGPIPSSSAGYKVNAGALVWF